MSFGEILRTAWKATWKYRAMWILGMAIITGGSGFSNLFNLIPDTDVTQFDSFSDYETQQYLNALEDVWHNYWILIVLLVVCLVLLVVLAYVFHYMALAGMVHGAATAQTMGEVRLSELCRVGASVFFPVFGISILFGLGTLALSVCVIVVLLLLAITIIGLVVAIPLAIVLLLAVIPAAWMINAWYQYALRGVVIRRLSMFASLQQGWTNMIATWQNALLAGLVRSIWTLATGMILFMASLVIIVPLAFLGYLAYTSQAWLALGLIALIGMALLLSIGLILKGITQSFYAHLWHGLYAGIAQR